MDTQQRDQFEEMMGYAPPAPEQREFRRDHARARKINELRDEGTKADYLDPAEASKDGYCAVSTVKSLLWQAADQRDHARYRSATEQLTVDCDGFAIVVEITSRSPYSDHPVVAAKVSTEAAVNRLYRAEAEDISFHSGRHGIQWGFRWKKEDIRTLAKVACEARNADLIDLLERETVVLS